MNRVMGCESLLCTVQRTLWLARIYVMCFLMESFHRFHGFFSYLGLLVVIFWRLGSVKQQVDPIVCQAVSISRH